MTKDEEIAYLRALVASLEQKLKALTKVLQEEYELLNLMNERQRQEYLKLHLTRGDGRNFFAGGDRDGLALNMRGQSGYALVQTALEQHRVRIEFARDDGNA